MCMWCDGHEKKGEYNNNTYLFVSLREGGDEWKFVQQGCFLKINSPFTCRIFQLKIKLTRSIFLSCCVDVLVLWMFLLILHATSNRKANPPFKCCLFLSLSWFTYTGEHHHFTIVSCFCGGHRLFCGHRLFQQSQGKKKQLSTRVMKVWLWRNTIFDRDYPWSIINSVFKVLWAIWSHKILVSCEYHEQIIITEVKKLFFPRLIDRCRIKERHCPISQLDNLC